MSAKFRRSQLFAFIGLPLLVAFVVVIALNFGEGANPTGALVLILGAVFGFMAVLLTLQRRDAAAAAGADADARIPAARDVHDPTTVDADTLLAALATGPLDPEAIRAQRASAWKMATDSIGAGARMTVLIFFAVVPWILFQFIWSIVVLVPVIVFYAGYLSMRAVGPGGQLDQGYEGSAATLRPLGLELTERPEISVEPRAVGPGAQKRIEGAVAFEGRRHGRPVAIRFEGLGSSIVVGAPSAEFEVDAKRERLRAAPGSPPAVEAALTALRASSYWRGVAVRGGPEGIVLTRRSGAGEHWLRDLWLAEELARAAPGDADT